MNFELSFHSAISIVKQLRQRKISAVELLSATISRIEKIDQKVNAVVVRDFEQAHLCASAADKLIASGQQLPLLGLPMTVKESFHIAGLPTTWGNPHYKNWCPDKDAVTIARLKAAGAIIIGKTNVPFMLGDWQTYNDIYGKTNNPWNIALTPGGSSGGSAATLAAGLISLELGSDLAGSLRVPAHYCGIYAHKPTLHLIPLRGATPPLSIPSFHRADLAVAGPMARSASDLSLALDILAGPDELTDGIGYKLALPKSPQKKLSDFRVLIIDEHPSYPTATIIQAKLEQLANLLMTLGVKVSRDTSALPDFAHITQLYTLCFTSAISPRFPIDSYKVIQAQADNLTPNDDSLHACRMRGTTLSHREWLILDRKRAELYAQWRALYQSYDVIICPTMPTTALPHDHSDFEQRTIDINDVKVPYADQLIWLSIAGLFGLPATVMPIGLSNEGLPVGVQIIGDHLHDKTTLHFASLLEKATGGFIAPLDNNF